MDSAVVDALLKLLPVAQALLLLAAIELVAVTDLGANKRWKFHR